MQEDGANINRIARAQTQITVRIVEQPLQQHGEASQLAVQRTGAAFATRLASLALLVSYS